MSQTPSEEYDQKKNKVCIIEFFTIMYYIPHKATVAATA